MSSLKIIVYLNFSKTQLVNSTTRNTNQIQIAIDYNNTTIPISSSTKFLGLTVDCTVMERPHCLDNKKTE